MNFSVVFPGQGSQSVGMLAELAQAYPVVTDTFTEASDVVGTDYWQLAQTGTNDVLGDTRVTQPLMFTSDIAVWRALQQAGLPMPTVVAGHSLGEFAALVAADALDFTDALSLVYKRAQLMAEAVPEGQGGMAALIGMDDDAVISVCEDTTGERIVEAVNFNAPGQVAISGHKDALEKAVELAKERGARKGVMLAVSVPNHSSLMRDAGQTLAESIERISWRTPTIPVVQNAQASVPANNDDMIGSLKAHMFSPVQWTKSIQTMRDQFNVALVLESGPGKVLSGLGKRIDKTMKTLPTDTPDALTLAVESTTAEA